MTMILYLLLQKPLNRGLIVKVFDRLSMLPTIHRHLEFLSFGNLLYLFCVFSGSPLPSLLRKAQYIAPELAQSSAVFRPLSNTNVLTGRFQTQRQLVITDWSLRQWKLCTTNTKEGAVAIWSKRTLTGQSKEIKIPADSLPLLFFFIFSSGSQKMFF